MAYGHNLQKSKFFANFKWQQLQNHVSYRAETNGNPPFSVRFTSVPIFKKIINGKCYCPKILGCLTWNDPEDSLVYPLVRRLFC